MGLNVEIFLIKISIKFTILPHFPLRADLYIREEGSLVYCLL
jgi:hypothetical protein